MRGEREGEGGRRDEEANRRECNTQQPYSKAPHTYIHTRLRGEPIRTVVDGEEWTQTFPLLLDVYSYFITYGGTHTSPAHTFTHTRTHTHTHAQTHTHQD